MRFAVVVAIALAPSIAAAENWNGTYEAGPRAGGDFCPNKTKVVVAGGKFSIPWIVDIGSLVEIGRIDGTVRDTGLAEFKVTFQDPLPKKVADVYDADRRVQLKEFADRVTLKFKESRSSRRIVLVSGMCSVDWVVTGKSDAPTPARSEDAPLIKPAKPFKAPPPVATGSAKWDQTYRNFGSEYGDWRCPSKKSFPITVKQGRLSFPFALDSEYGSFIVGQIDGTVAADGKVKLRVTTIDELPAELGDKHTIADLRSFAGTMTFTAEARGKKAKLGFGGGNAACTHEFIADDYTAVKYVQPEKPKLTNGFKCGFDSDCITNNCSSHRCASRDSNRPDYSPGTECRWDSECASGSCSSRVCK